MSTNKKTPNTRQMAKYKFRAECEHDLNELSKLIRNNKKEATIEAVKHAKFPDCEAIISTELTLVEIRSTMKEITDGHVMRQTIKPLHEYNGERDYSL